MIECDEFATACQEFGFDFFTGVPDSTFKSWMSYLGRNDTDITNVTTVNECEATAVGAGYHLATGDIGVVYLQNDGLGKCVNPLTSLTNEEVYNIPLLLMIGWRSEPGIDDAVQHDKMGEILLDLLELLDIPYQILPEDIDEVRDVLQDANAYMESEETPYAIIVRQDLFEPDTGGDIQGPGTLSREEAVKIAAEQLGGNELVISTTGKLSRELYEHRKDSGDGLGNDFYNVGAMGCAQSIGLGAALGQPDRNLVVFDGDGSVLMQMGAMATAGNWEPGNFHHVIFDNQAHESTGGQATSSGAIHFEDIAKGCNYNSTNVVSTEVDIRSAMDRDLSQSGPTLTVIKISRGVRSDLGRPTEPLTELKELFMKTAQS